MASPAPLSPDSGKPTKACIDELYKELRTHFQELDKSQTKLTYYSIHEFLSRKAGNNFDRHLLTDLFKKMNKTEEMMVSSEEFMRTYTEAGLMLTEEIESLHREIEEYKSKLQSIYSALEKVSDEQLTSLGIMVNSYLSIEVVEAQNLGKGSGSVYVSATCCDKTFRTAEVKLSGYTPWDAKFTFPISSPDAVLSVQVVHTDAGRSEKIGEIAVPLSSLRDQKEREDIADIGPGKIRLRYQWIWSEKKKLSEAAQEVEESQRYALQSLENVNKSFDQLQAPLRSKTLGGKMISLFWTNRQEGRATQVELVTSRKPAPEARHHGTALWIAVAYAAVTVFAAFSLVDFPNVTCIHS